MAKPRYFLQCSGSAFWPALCDRLTKNFDLSFMLIDDRLESQFAPTLCAEVLHGNDLKFGLFDRLKCRPFPNELKDDARYRRREKEAMYSFERSTVGGEVDVPDRLHIISSMTDFFWHYFSRFEPSFGIATEAPHTFPDLLLHGIAESCSIPILHFQQNAIAPTVRPVLGPQYEKLDLADLLEPNIDSNRRHRISVYRQNFENFIQRASEPSLTQHEVDFHDRERKTFSGIRSPWRRFYIPYSWLLAEWNQLESYALRTKVQKEHCPTPTHSLERIQHRVQLGPRAVVAARRQAKMIKGLQRSLALNASSKLPQRCATFFLQFEPEKTSIPDGGLYGDQLAAVRAVAEGLDGRLPLVVCEHPSQLTLLSRGFRVRRPRFYDELANIPNVLIAPLGYPRADLMRRTSIAITLQGSIGLEAIARGVPAIALGHPWYSPLSGIFGPTEAKHLSRIIEEALSFNVDVGALSELLWRRVEQDQIVALLNPSSSREFPNVDSDVETIAALTDSLFLG